MARHVQPHRDEPADRGQVVLAQDAGGVPGIARQESRRPQLGRGQAHLGHLSQHPARAELIPPARHLAHAP